MVDAILLTIFAFIALTVVALSSGCAAGSCSQHDTEVPAVIECTPPNSWLEEPPCWARKAEDRIVRTWEANYGPLTAEERACVADYWFAVLPEDVWRGDEFRFGKVYPDAIGLHMPSGIIYIIGCNPRRSPEDCYGKHADIQRHEILHGIHQCTGSAGNADHSSVAWRLLGKLELEPVVEYECVDTMMSSYCDLPGRECYEHRISL